MGNQGVAGTSAGVLPCFVSIISLVPFDWKCLWLYYSDCKVLYYSMDPKKEGSLWDAKVRGRLHGRDERVVRALKMFILSHSWAPAEDILCWLGFWLALNWVPSIVVLAWQEGAMWEVLCPCHSPSPCERKCLPNEPIPESLAFQINK